MVAVALRLATLAGLLEVTGQYAWSSWCGCGRCGWSGSGFMIAGFGNSTLPIRVKFPKLAIMAGRGPTWWARRRGFAGSAWWQVDAEPGVTGERARGWIGADRNRGCHRRKTFVWETGPRSARKPFGARGEPDPCSLNVTNTPSDHLQPRAIACEVVGFGMPKPAL